MTTTLLEIALRSSAIALAGLALMPLLRRHSAALRHWVLFTCLIGAAAVPLAMWLLPRWEIAAVSSLVPPPLVDGVNATLNTSAVPPISQLAPAADVSSLTGPASAWPAIVMPLWLTGIVLSLATLLVGVLRLRHIDKNATPAAEGCWHDIVLPNASVRVTERRGLLLVWGLRHSTIIVPATALAWSRERMRAVLHHELAHVRRRDWPLLIAAEVVRAIYWFNPLVWIVCARLRTEAEIACDDAVIADGAQGAEYASHVIDTARELRREYWLPAPAMVRPSTLERRVRAMLDNTRNRTPLSTRARRTAVALTLSLTLAVAALAAQSFVSLSGTIVDPTNGLLPEVKLILVNEQTKAKYEIQTDKTGRYEFVGLPPGNYTMDATIPGFRRFTGQVFVAGQNLQQDLQLQIGMLEETVTIAAGPPGTPEPPARPGLTDEQRRKLEELRSKRAQQAMNVTGKCAPEPPPGNPRIGGNIRVPLKFKDKRPVYPEALRGTAGKVVLQTTLGQDGRIGGITVVESTHQEFTDSAIAAIREWEFDATLLNCQGIETPMKITVNYDVIQ